MKLYEIYDGQKHKLFDDYPEIEAKTGKEAIMKHLSQTGRGHYKIKRSAGRDVIFKAQAFYRKDGYEQKYRNGNAIWYAIQPID